MKSAATRSPQERRSPVRDGASAAPAPLRRKGERRAEPVLSEVFAHLSVEALREYRRALTEEENKVSYWRRILQARLDLVATGTTSKGVEHERLTPLLTGERLTPGRSGLVQVVEVDDTPPLPSLAELWDRQVDPSDGPGRDAFEDDLRTAEAQLSSYRTALHGRIGKATGELIARYREQPSLCLTALPLPRSAAGH